MKKLIFSILILLSCSLCSISAKTISNPVEGLAERISPGSSKHFRFEIEDELCEKDFFSLESLGGKIKIAGNNWISIATGLNWYLKYYAHVNITWENPKQIVTYFPKVAEPVRRETDCLIRYYFSYNTFTYSTPFWNWERWQQEIDFMALHGINVALALTGSQGVWYNTLQKFGYNDNEIKQFLGDATHNAQVLQGKMEGGADSLSIEWFDKQVTLARKIILEYYKWGISPVLPGFSGMVPSNFTEKTGISTNSLGVWGDVNRPSVIDPKDPGFKKTATVYYEELHKLLGNSKYYSMDLEKIPEGINAFTIGQEIFSCMNEATDESVWVTSNPDLKMVDGLPAGRLLILDAESETRPRWGDPDSPLYSEEGYLYHDWVLCQKLNYGGRLGFYGKIQRLINSYYSALSSEKGKHIRGVGATMDAIGSNHAMWELLYELPWRSNTFLASKWIGQFIKARYGHTSEKIEEAWNLITDNLYTPDPSSLQEGATESVFCSRPSLSVDNVSKNGTTACYYDESKVKKALSLLLDEYEKLKFSENYSVDIRELARTVNADYAKILLKEIEKNFESGDTISFEINTDKFLNSITLQDNLMNCSKETMVGNWIESSMASGTGYDESNFLRRDARRLITTWSESRTISNNEQMHDYANREWGGLLRDYYYERWLSFFKYIGKHHKLPIGYDFFDMENDWVIAQNPYSFTPATTSYNMARRILMNINDK